MIPLDTGDNEWPKIARGGHLRNAKGEALVIPEGGGRKRRAIGGSGLDVFYVYTGPQNYGDQGSHVHTVTEHADDGRGVTPELIAAGEAVGVSAETTHHCHDTYLEFINDLGWRTVLTECIVVNDEYGVPIASNIDKVMWTPDGHVVIDVKSSNSFSHRGYAMQLAAYVDSSIYDPLTGERTPLPRPLITDKAYILSYTVRTDDPTWMLVEVDVGIGRELLVAFDELRSDDRHKAAFTIAPPSSSPEVEAPAGGDATHGSEPSPPATLDEWRAAFDTWDTKKQTAFKKYLADYRYSPEDADEVKLNAYRDFHEVYHFHDVATHAPSKPVTPPKPEALPVVVDEGDDITEGDLWAAGKRYGDLPKFTRSWVTVTGSRVRLSPAHGGRPSVRRFELLRGLCALAEAGFDNDDIVRAVAHHILGDIVWQGAPAAAVVAALDLDEAARFARMCDALAGAADVSLRYTDDGRAVLEPSVLGVSA